MKIEETIEMKFFWSEQEVNEILQNLAVERIEAQGFRYLSKVGYHDDSGFTQNYTVKRIDDDSTFEIEDIKS